ncbi:MAG: helix-turn-helix domain-containing protein [Acidobacteria bacterium]|nr:helix-turn-helix domain-containing protein [Acidobacteriota bacterium]
MDLKTYAPTMRALDDLAKQVDSSSMYLWQIANRWKGRKAGPHLAIAIESATQGAVTRADLRPDIFGKPEVSHD